MRIGITERGDAGINLAWVDKMSTVDGAVLITKNITEEFKAAVLNCNKPLIVHCTCTGYGGTFLEPNVPDYKTQIDNLRNLIDRGFPAERCVLRIDPIFPTDNGLAKVHNVIQYFESTIYPAPEKEWEDEMMGRIRVSVVDEYQHVKDRYRRNGITPLYGNNFQASDAQLNLVIRELSMYPMEYEVCAENRLYQLGKEKYEHLFKVIGCISKKDLDLMGVNYTDMDVNPQGRNGCHCLSCKTELLTDRKPCPNGCLYCYWRG